MDPENINFKFNKSYILLKKKLFEKGWKLYENRILADYKNDKIYNLIKNNLYLKKNLPKKQKIIIVPEQGIGDHVLFSSIYPDIINKFKGLGKNLDNLSLETVKMFYDDAKNAGYKIKTNDKR